MKSVLIVENSTNSLSKINESNNKSNNILGGIFTEFDIKNRNERIYTADRFLPCLEEMNERIQNLGSVYGEFDHPDVFDTSLARASHLVTKAEFVKENNRVEGEIRLLNTHWGKEAQALVNDGCPVFVSSRAAGITESDGTVTLKKLFTYDIVADPGFASAKMNVKTLNESFGFSNKANFRIYEMSDESKINDLFNMNTNDLVTKQQLTDYSKYLINELASTKKEVRSAIKKGNLNPKKLEQLLEYYENLNDTNSQIVKYLDYLAEKVQVVVNENTTLKTTAEKLIKHNDYLAESLEKAINYTEYVAENLDKNIEYSEYLAENLDKNISYSEYIAENLDKNISYSEYLAENLDKNIAYSEYLAENLDKNIAYAEYIAENLDKNISYSEYLAEHLDNSIAYSEYLAEHVEGNIAYSEYIAENLDDNIAYSEYIAENLDKSISYQSLIVEKLNGGKLFESNEEEEERLPSLNVVGIESYEEEENDKYEEDENSWNDSNEAPSADETPKLESNESDSYEADEAEETPSEAEEKPYEVGETSSEAEETPKYEGNSDTELSKSIDKLIEEAKKRKAVETSDLHFLKFLSQARLYPAEVMSTDSQVEHFWMTRNLKKNESVTKKLVSHESLIQEDKISEQELSAIMERFKNL